MPLWAWISITLLAWLTLSTAVGLIVGALLRRITCEGSVSQSAGSRRPAKLRLVRSRSSPAGP